MQVTSCSVERETLGPLQWLHCSESAKQKAEDVGLQGEVGEAQAQAGLHQVMDPADL